MSTARNFRFGALAPDRPERDRCLQQLLKAHDYYNKLVEIERERRLATQVLMRDFYPRIAKLEALIERRNEEIQDERDRISLENARARRQTATAEQQRRVDRLQRLRRRAYAALRTAKAEAFGPPGLQQARKELAEYYASVGKKKNRKKTKAVLGRLDPAKEARLKEAVARELAAWHFAVPTAAAFTERLAYITDRAGARRREERKASGVYSGTYLVTEMAFDAALDSGEQPHFRRRRPDGTADGQLGVQLAKGPTYLELLAGTPTVRIERVSGSRKCYLHMRVYGTGANGKGGKGVFARVPFVMHRELPPNAKVKWVRLCREQLGTRDRWTVLFSLVGDTSTFAKPAAAAGSVTVNPGWRRLPHGLRVATWLTDLEGPAEVALLRDLDAIAAMTKVAFEEILDEHGEPTGAWSMVFPERMVGRWRRVDELVGLRDDAFNDIVAKLAAWTETVQLPEWLAGELQFMAKWYEPYRLRQVLGRWRTQRFEADGLMMERLEAWAALDDYRYDEQANLADKAVAWRKYVYQKLAWAFRRHCRRMVIAKIDYHRLKRRPTPEERKVLTEARWYIRVAASAVLAGQLGEISAAPVALPPELMTKRCSFCLGVCDFDAAANVTHQCEHCGAFWDQDYNHVRNLRLVAEGEGAYATA